MRSIIMAGLSLIMVNPAFALFDRPIQPCDNVPPKGYDRPVSVNLDIQTVASDVMHKLCHIPQHGNEILYGCWVPGSTVHVYLNADMNEAETVCTMHHELGELPPNGWQDPLDLPNPYARASK